MLQRYILIWLLISSAVAWFWPQFGFAFDPYQWLGGTGINVLIVVAMLGVGALLKVQELNDLFRQWPTVLTGTAVQYISMPLLAWLAVKLFQPSPELATGIIIVGCVPGAMASNVLTLTARGNVSYSVCLTTLATILSPIVVPLALKLTLGHDVRYDGFDAVKMMLFQVVLPVIVGHLLSRYWAWFRLLSERVAPTAANLAVLLIISIVVALKRDQVRTASAEVLLPLTLINLFGYLAGYFAAHRFGLAEPMRRAITIEVGMQNAGAGTALAIQLFGNQSAAIIPCVMYTFGCMLSGTLLATVWNRIPPDTSALSITDVG